MFLTTARSALSVAGLPWMGLGGAAIAQPANRPRSRARRKRVAARAATHSLLADAGGVWAWSVADAYARPERYANVQSWMELNPGARLDLWLAADLISDRAESRVLDLEVVRLHAERSEVAIKAVKPWWTHAYEEANRCVPALLRTGSAEVCVVEGREISFVSITGGAPFDVSCVTLKSPTLDALRDVFDARRRARDDAPRLTVALGQGLFDGDRSDGLDAHVLGRLDGHQPPHWLRPTGMSTRF